MRVVAVEVIIVAAVIVVLVAAVDITAAVIADVAVVVVFAVVFAEIVDAMILLFAFVDGSRYVAAWKVAAGVV